MLLEELLVGVLLLEAPLVERAVNVAGYPPDEHRLALEALGGHEGHADCLGTLTCAFKGFSIIVGRIGVEHTVLPIMVGVAGIAMEAMVTFLAAVALVAISAVSSVVSATFAVYANGVLHDYYRVHVSRCWSQRKFRFYFLDDCDDCCYGSLWRMFLRFPRSVECHEARYPLT